MRIEKVLMSLLIVGDLYEFVRELLIVLGLIHGNQIDLIFAIFVVFSAGILFTHRYWILAFIYSGLNIVFKYIALNLINHPEEFTFSLLMVMALASMSASLFYLYKLLISTDFSFNKYFRFNKLNKDIAKKIWKQK